MDFKKAYDSVHRNSLWNAMQEFGIPRKLINMTRLCMEDTYNIVTYKGRKSDPFQITSGLKQGDALSPLLFNLALEKVVRKVKEDCVIGGTSKMLGYADDIDIIGENEQKTLEILTHLKEKAQQMGLVINQDKTEYMVISREGTTKNSGHMQIDNMTIKRTETYRYLGTIFNCSNIIREEIQARINSGNKIYYALQHLLKSNALSRNTKITIYKTLIRPIVLYGSETWSTTKRDEALLQTFENKVLRRIFGPIRDTQSGEWKRRSNKDIHDLFKSPLITGIMKANRLQWLGHIERMEDNRETKLAYTQEINDRRPRGRPRRRWRDNIHTDLQALGITNWQEKVNQRDEWRRLVSAAKNLNGSEC